MNTVLIIAAWIDCHLCERETDSMNSEAFIYRKLIENLSMLFMLANGSLTNECMDMAIINARL